MRAEVRPKESKGTLEPIPNSFIVQNGMLYDYYPIRFGEVKGSFVELQKLPGLVTGGYVTYQKQLYTLSIQDFLRSRLNVGIAAYTVPTTTNSAGASITAAAAPTSSDPGNITSFGQSFADATFGVQINKAADMAWKDQIDALLHSIDPEEEWIDEALA